MEQETPPLSGGKFFQGVPDFLQGSHALVGLLQWLRGHFKEQAGVPGTAVTVTEILFALAFHFPVILRKYLENFMGYFHHQRGSRCVKDRNMKHEFTPYAAPSI